MRHFPLFKVHIDSDAATRLLKETLDSGFLNEGRQVADFTNEIQKWAACEVIALNSCTSALTLALHLLNLQPGDEVVTPSMTCVATNTPIQNSRAKLVWADIDPKTGTLSPEDVERRITSRTKAVMCMNWAGCPCDLEALQSVCEKRNVKLIQDAAHSFGAKMSDEFCDAYADFTCFSFQAIKHISVGDGGLLSIRDPKTMQRAKALKWFGIDRDRTKDEVGSWKGQAWDYDIIEAGYKFNMNNLNAAIGLSQLPHIDPILRAHRRNAEVYRQAFASTDRIEPIQYPANATPSFWVYTVLLKDSTIRDEVLRSLNAEGILAGLVHVPNHHYTCFKDCKVDLPGTDYFHEHQISLPCGWWLTEDDTAHIAARLSHLVCAV